MKLLKFGTLIATAGVALLVGLSRAEARELRFSRWGGDERHKATFDIINKFQEADPGVTIKGELAANAGYLERLTTRYAGGSEPDIIQMDWSYLWVFSKRGDGFVDLNTLKNVIKLDAFNKTDLASTTINGKLNALPHGFTARLMVHNSDPWKKAGIEYPKTWDELRAAAFQSRLGPDYYPLDNNRLDWLLLTHMWATQKFGTTFIGATEPKIKHTREQLVEWMTMLKTPPAQTVSVPLPARVSIGGTAEKESQEIQQWVSGRWGGNYTWDSVTPPRASFAICAKRSSSRPPRPGSRSPPTDPDRPRRRDDGRDPRGDAVARPPAIPAVRRSHDRVSPRGAARSGRRAHVVHRRGRNESPPRRDARGG